MQQLMYTINKIMQRNTLHRYIWSHTLDVNHKCIQHHIRYSSTQSIKQYDVKSIESKWQHIWSQSQYQYRQSTDANKHKYILTMFPYPSGQLHIGHVRVYTVGDVTARYNRLLNYSVIHPIGFDSFGLPAENASIEHNIHPAKWTEHNIHTMTQQLHPLGISFDWQRSVVTSDVKYYKWTQWLFLQLYKHGLAYQKHSYVNYDPIDKTVLANEQVDANGRSWRSGAVVEQKLLKQWYFKISAYSERLLSGLDKLQHWPSKVKHMQRNWIGRSDGALIKFNVQRSDNVQQTIQVFTSRPDTIYGVTYIAVAYDYTLLNEWLDSNMIDTAVKQQIQQYIEQCKQQAVDKSTAYTAKTGINTTINVIHPLTNEPIPVYICDYVLSSYGTGCVMGVPAHDTRDHVFAQDYKIPIKHVVRPIDSSIEHKGLYTDTNGIVCNSDASINDKTTTEAANIVVQQLTATNQGHAHTEYRLNDWLVSRQRYWGCPIPIIHCTHCGTVPVPIEQLPIELPNLTTLTRYGNPLESDDAIEWRQCKCPECNRDATHETDTLDTFIDSSWYYLRYLDPHNNTHAFNTDIVKQYMPVDTYIGGIEHAILHLLYSRFIMYCLYDIKYVNVEEPFGELVTQGMVCAQTFRLQHNNKPVKPVDVIEKTVDGSKQYATVIDNTEYKLIETYEKMSKSKYNGIDPLSVIDQYGADVLRMFIIFLGPIEQEVQWSNTGIVGMARYSKRLYTLVQRHVDAYNMQTTHNDTSNTIQSIEQNAVQYITEQYRDKLYNVAVAGVMKYTNDLITAANNANVVQSTTFNNALKSLLIMLSPIAPHITAELYQQVCELTDDNKNTIHDVHKQTWPVVQSITSKQAQHITVVVMRGNKRIAEHTVDTSMANNKSALEQYIVQHTDALHNVTVKRFVHVPSKANTPNVKLINVVIQSIK